MKKIKSLLAVATLLMVLGFVLPVGQAGATPDEGIAICNDMPPADTIGIS